MDLGSTSPAPRSRAVVVAVVLTHVGAGLLLLSGLIFLFGTGEGTFFGRPTSEISLSGMPVAIDAAPVVGLLLVVFSVVLVALGVLAQRGHRAGRLGLTAVGVFVIVGLAYVVVVHDAVSPLVPAAWIALALVLLWAGRSRRSRV